MLFALLQLLLSEEGINLDFEDQVINETTVTHNGQIHSPVIRGPSWAGWLRIVRAGNE